MPAHGKQPYTVKILFVTTVHMNKYLIDRQLQKAFLLLHCYYRCHLCFHWHFHHHFHCPCETLWDCVIVSLESSRTTFSTWADTAADKGTNFLDADLGTALPSLRLSGWDNGCDHPTSAAVAHFFVSETAAAHFFVSETAASSLPSNWHLFRSNLVVDDFKSSSSPSSSLSKSGLFHFADTNFEAACCSGLDLTRGHIALGMFLRSMASVVSFSCVNFSATASHSSWNLGGLPVLC